MQALFSNEDSAFFTSKLSVKDQLKALRVRQADRTAMAEDLAYVFNLSERNDFRDELKKRAKWLYDK